MNKQFFVVVNGTGKDLHYLYKQNVNNVEKTGKIIVVGVPIVNT